MFKHLLFSNVLVLAIFSQAITHTYAKEANILSLDDAVKQILKQYPSIKIARLEVEQARQEFSKIESQLGWVLNAQSGISRDVATFDIPRERFDASVNLSSINKSGSSIELSGDYAYEESDTSVIPSLVNPSERTRLDLNYRIPFAQGADNPNYNEGLELAKAGFDITLADKINQTDALISLTANLFYDAAATVARIDDANASIKRSLRLLQYVEKNKSLGLVERKDYLDANALYMNRIAERDNLLVIWSRQRSELNRLIGFKASNEFSPDIAEQKRELVRDNILSRVYEVSPTLQFQLALLKQTESEIILANDAKKDQLDLVLSVGARNTSGDTALGSVSSDEWAGGARLEYRFSFDQRGFDADLYQKVLRKQSVEEEITRIKTEIDYDVDSLLEQIKRSETSIKSIKKRLSIEKEKVTEAFERYKTGRSNTTELIDNENALFASSLLYKTRSIELSRMYSELDLLLGELWDSKVLLTHEQSTE